MILLMLLFSHWHIAAADHAEDRTSHTERQTIDTEAQLISASDDINDTEDHTSDTEARIITHQGQQTDMFHDNLVVCAFQSDSDHDCINEVTRGVGAISTMMDNVSDITIDSFDIALIPVRLHTCSALSRLVSPAAYCKKPTMFMVPLFLNKINDFIQKILLHQVRISTHWQL